MPREMTPEERFERIERTLDFVAHQQAQFFSDLQELRGITDAHSEQIADLSRIAHTHGEQIGELSRIAHTHGEQIGELSRIAHTHGEQIGELSRIAHTHGEQIGELKDVALLHERRSDRAGSLIERQTEHMEQLRLELERSGERFDRHIEESRHDRRLIRALLERFGGSQS